MIELGVDQRGIERAVPQDIGDFLERAAALEQLAGKGVAQGVDATMGNPDTTIGIPHDPMYGVGADGHVARRDMAHKHGPVCAPRTLET